LQVVLVLLWLVGLATALDCYICNKTVKTVDRFTKEVKEEQVCTQEPTDWDIETCSDPRHFCWKLKVQQDYFTTVYNRGCAIPQDVFAQSWVLDSLEKPGGNTICWYKLRKGGYYDGDDSCFCNTNLCNLGPRYLASFALALLPIILTVL